MASSPGLDRCVRFETQDVVAYWGDVTTCWVSKMACMARSLAGVHFVAKLLWRTIHLPEREEVQPLLPVALDPILEHRPPSSW